MTNRIHLILAALLAVPALDSRVRAEAPPDPVALLQTFIRARTVNPPGNESALTLPLAALFRQEGMAVELTGATPARMNLIVKIPGSSRAKPWLLLAHVDTVYANPAEWKVDPFAARISEGVLWGRGAIDDKGMAAALAAALIRIHRQGPRRVGITAIFAVDEETGSAAGLEWLLEKRPEFYDVAGVLNEGGFTLVDRAGPAEKTYYVSTGEKGVLWVRLRAPGIPGHGSIRWGDNAVERLVQALSRISAWEHPLVTDNPLARFAEQDLASRGIKSLSAADALAHHPLGKAALSDVKLASTLRDTCNPTVLKAGEKPNVIPAMAEAIIDCRLAPGQTTGAFVAELRRRVADPRIEFEILTQGEPNESPWPTPLYAALVKTAHALSPQALVAPTLSSGATDSRLWRARGCPAYGIVPLPVPPDFVMGMHGKDERVPVAAVTEGADFLTMLLTEITAQGK